MAEKLTCTCSLTKRAFDQSKFDAKGLAEIKLREALRREAGCQISVSWTTVAHEEAPDDPASFELMPIMIGRATAERCETATYWKEQAAYWKERALDAIGVVR